MALFFVDEGALGFVEAEEDVAFLEKRGLRGVDVFGGLGVGGEDAAAEGDDFAEVVANREHDAVAEAVVEIALGILGVAQGDQAALDDLVALVVLAGGPGTEGVPFFGA
jgi:hypothetical protein